MFKTSHSPLNANKDNKYYNQQPDYQPQSYHQSTYQYSKYNNNNGNNTGYHNQRVQSNNNGMNAYGNNAPLCPLSPNVSKNPPTSPNAKIKMFSNTLNVNRKNSSQASNLYQPSTQNTHDPKQNKFGRLGAKNLVLDLTQSLDLKCDQTFDQPLGNNNYRKQPPQTCTTNKQQNYPRRASSKIPVLNFEAEVDDLKCDEVLVDVKTTTEDKRKANSILMRKNTDRQIYLNNTSSNPSPQNMLPTQQKPRSFTNIISPYNPHKKSPQNSTQQQANDTSPPSTQSEIYQPAEMSSIQQVDQLKRNLQRMSAVLEAYMRKCDDMRERQTALERENDQLRRCLYEDAGSKGVNQGHNITSASRYQGIK